MKPVKNLVANQGECNAANPLSGFVGSFSGGMDKSRLMNRMIGAQNATEVVSPLISHISQGDGADAAFYNLSAATRVASHNNPLEDWSGQFSSAHVPNNQQVYVPHMQSAMNPMHHIPPMAQIPMFNRFQAPVYTPQGPLVHSMAPSVISSPQSVQKDSQQSLSVNDDLAAAKRMVEMLRNSGNPKYANSTFVDFIDQVANRELSFKDDTVVDKDGKVVDWDSLYEDPVTTSGGLGDLLEAAGDDAENFPDQMDRIWNELRQDHDFLTDATYSTDYVFQHASNPYIDSSETNLLQVALRLMA